MSKLQYLPDRPVLKLGSDREASPAEIRVYVLGVWLGVLVLVLAGYLLGGR